MFDNIFESRSVSAMELFEFRFSTYNEKVRWALAHKGLAYDSRPQLPGLHMKTMTALSGQTATPVLRDGERVIPGSATILRYLDERHPARPLHPMRSAALEEALEWQRWLDDDVGPDLRYALFADVVGDGGFSGRVFTLGAPAWKGTLYRTAYPMMSIWLRKKLDFTDEKVAKARATVEAALDRYAERMRGRDYLIGDEFSIADLAAAAIFFPTCWPDELEIPVPRDRRSAQRWTARWAGHPALDHVRRLYRLHRGAVATTDARLSGAA